MCGETCGEEEDAFQLLDGGILHWKCFFLWMFGSEVLLLFVMHISSLVGHGWLGTGTPRPLKVRLDLPSFKRFKNCYVSSAGNIPLRLQVLPLWAHGGEDQRLNANGTAPQQGVQRHQGQTLLCHLQWLC